jgi:hypothetical protein
MRTRNEMRRDGTISERSVWLAPAVATRLRGFPALLAGHCAPAPIRALIARQLHFGLGFLVGTCSGPMYSEGIADAS